VSGACGTRIPHPSPVTARIDFTAHPSQSTQCDTPDRFAWGVRETGDGELVFDIDPALPLGPELKIPYSLTCEQITESNARRAERRHTMMALTVPQLVYVDGAVLSPEIVAPDGVLSGASQTFTWDAHDTQADAWAVWLGSTPGGKQYGVQVANAPDATSLLFHGLPYQGQPVHATLWWRVNGVWHSRRHEMHASGT
jgi:hypothetical protein